MKNTNWKKYGFEFLSIFIAVLSAFALNNWSDNRRDNNAENKILTEIANGLKQDINDIRENKGGHHFSIRACVFWRNIIEDTGVDMDSLAMYYFELTRDYISIQNISGYETLKSKGLELVEDDSLRFSIISLYEYDYNILRKFEEEYHEMQFQENYFKEINSILVPNFIFDERGMMEAINCPINLSEADKKTLLVYLWKIQGNRQFILHYYSGVEDKVNKVLEQIEEEVNF